MHNVTLISQTFRLSCLVLALALVFHPGRLSGYDRYFPPTAAQKISECPPNEMRIVWTYNGYLSSYAVDFGGKKLMEANVLNPPGKEPQLNYDKIWPLNTAEIYWLRERGSKLPATDNDTTKNLEGDMHVAYWNNGHLCILHYSHERYFNDPQLRPLLDIMLFCAKHV